MKGNFKYYNPTKLYFGKDSLDFLAEELKNYGKNVLLIYGGGSIKKNGIYDKVTDILKKCGKTIIEDNGVMPNPTIEKLLEGIQRARDGKVDFLLAVGGGSTIDYAKALSASIHFNGDPWDTYYIKQLEPQCEIVPMGCILTMVGTGSEMNGGAVITNPSQKLKIGHVFGENVYPKFSILNPEFTLTVPKNQMIAGIYDAFNHICEQYFSDDGDCASDYLMEGLMRSIIVSSKAAVKNPLDYEARSNLMWDATWALNTLLSRGKKTDWMVHMIGQAIGAYTNATHGFTLSAISLAYYDYILPFGINQFKKFAINVFNVNPKGKSDIEIAREGLIELKKWMSDIGLIMNISELGVTDKMIDGIADATLLNQGGFKKLSREDVINVLINSK